MKVSPWKASFIVKTRVMGMVRVMGMEEEPETEFHEQLVVDETQGYILYKKIQYEMNMWGRYRDMQRRNGFQRNLQRYLNDQGSPIIIFRDQ